MAQIIRDSLKTKYDDCKDDRNIVFFLYPKLGGNNEKDKKSNLISIKNK